MARRRGGEREEHTSGEFVSNVLTLTHQARVDNRRKKDRLLDESARLFARHHQAYLDTQGIGTGARVGGANFDEDIDLGSALRSRRRGREPEGSNIVRRLREMGLLTRDTDLIRRVLASCDEVEIPADVLSLDVVGHIRTRLSRREEATPLGNNPDSDTQGMLRVFLGFVVEEDEEAARPERPLRR